MILIFSDKTDYSTQSVCDWLDSDKVNYKIIYPEHNIVINSLLILNNKIEFDFLIQNLLNEEIQVIKFSEISSVWFRRGFLNLNKIYFKEIASNSKYFGNELLNFHLKEYNSITNFIYESFIRYKKILGNPFKFDINKLTMLLIAQECGLSIPKTYLTSQKELLKQFIKNSKNGIISKGIQNGFYFEKDGNFHTTYTEQFYNEDLDKVNDTFFYSLFQDKIIKKYEIRSFYIDNRFFSMVIHSQENPQTQVDFRKYDDINPNKVEPFLLPKKIENKLKNVSKAYLLEQIK